MSELPPLGGSFLVHRPALPPLSTNPRRVKEVLGGAPQAQRVAPTLISLKELKKRSSDDPR